MPEIFTTPCAKAEQSGFKLLRWIFRGKRSPQRRVDNKQLPAAGIARKQEAPASHRQSRPARQTRLNVQNALAQQTFGETSTFTLNNDTAKPISEVLEDISQNISKMDQNLYAAKANTEEILRADSNDTEFVSLD